MQKCSYCGADLPAHSRFCGKCGSVQDVNATDASATMSSNTPQPQSWASGGGTQPATWPPPGNYPAQNSAPTWPPNIQVPATPPPPPAIENEDERRRVIPPWSPLYSATLGADALLSSGQAYPSGAPVVQGTPQFGSVPSVSGSPTPYTNVPAGHPSLGQAPASVGHPTLGSANAPIIHPVQGPGNSPISYPVQGPQPIHHPIQPPGTQDHDPIHKHHGHRTHHIQHTASHVTKLAGGSTIKTVIIVVTALVVVTAGGIGAAAYFLLRPQPLISITSNYMVGNTLAGANGTILHISGQKFSHDSAITFLLDDHAAPGNPGTRSDSSGNFSANVTITNAWSVGNHTLTARDASNYSTKNSVSVTVVQQGQANTPGPNGAPPDDASFKIITHIQGSQSTETEVVTGHPDPTGGTVCQPEDNGQPIVTTGVTSPAPIPVRITNTYSCTAGSYKGGKLTLIEKLTSSVRDYSLPDGTTTTCTLISTQPVTDEQLSGSYTGNNTFSGTITYPAIPDSDFSCHGDGTYTFYNFDKGGQHTWTGSVTDLHR